MKYYLTATRSSCQYRLLSPLNTTDNTVWCTEYSVRYGVPTYLPKDAGTLITQCAIYNTETIPVHTMVETRVVEPLIPSIYGPRKGPHLHSLTLRGAS